MLKAGALALLLAGLAPPAKILAAQDPGLSARLVLAQEIPPSAAQASAPAVERPAPRRYTLSPEERARAVAYARGSYVLYFLGVLVSLGIYLSLWLCGIAARFRDAARRVSPRHVVQCLVFVPLIVILVQVLEFPLAYYADFLFEHRFDLSTQGFGSWLADWAKSLAVTAALGTLVVWILYAVIRRSPRRWWLVSWLVNLPLTLAFILAQPLALDPMYHKFMPLANSRPTLAARIQEMLRRGGVEIPAARIYLMDASSKTRALNAYLTGLGASKRVVVWDTTLGKMSEDEVLLVLGHEAGHYVLQHIPKEFALIELVVLALFCLGSVALGWMVGRWGRRIGVESVGDLASLPIAMLLVTVLTFLSSPVINAISRHYEHQADQFGLELAYGVVPDPNAAEARSLEILGKIDLADPDPNPFIRFWLYSHPPLDERIRFAANYKPWAEGKPLELVHPHL